jgi:mannose-6-phosphate isomerase
MLDPLTFVPLYQERVWGGRALAGFPGRTLPPDRPIGESWEIVDRPEAQSVIADGPLAGLTLHAALRARGADLLGPAWPIGRPFPILVKWLDCADRLSLQVHPPAELATELGGEPKTENWFIAAAQPGAALIVGLRPGVDRQTFERAIAENSLDRCVNRVPVAPGDSVLVRSGTVHAIDAGNLILEIQQNSDTTYRVYDWGRVGLDGKPRQLHLEESLRSILWDAGEPLLVRREDRAAVIADCDEFRLRRLPLAAGERLLFLAGEQCRLLHVVEGSVVGTGASERTYRRGDNLLLPYASALEFTASEQSLVLLTENFA